MICYNCQAKMIKEVSDYLYKESGLDNVVLRGFQVYGCPQCGQKYPILSNIQSIHKTIAKALVRQSSPLRGKELAFLRKELRLCVDELAQISAFPAEQIKVWEHNNEIIHPAFDRIIRMYFENLDILNGCRAVVGRARQYGDIKDEIERICRSALESKQVLSQIERHERRSIDISSILTL